MSLSQLVAPHLPYLRRLARALTGSQQSGDAYAVAALEAIVANPDLLKPNMPPRVALYKVLFDIWRRVPTNVAENTSHEGGLLGMAERNVQRNLSSLDMQPRAAFLLEVIEGLTRDEIGQILDLSQSDVAALIVRAGHEISDQIASDVLIIEDEPIIAMDIEALVEDLGHRVVGLARTHAEALESVKSHRQAWCWLIFNWLTAVRGLML
jgi:DNA-directed RNA polymerase specialized sigma24 family protein